MKTTLETVFDIEADGLLDTITKVHVLSYQDETMSEPVSIFCYDEIRKFMDEDRVFIGHNIIMYDLPALKKIIGISDKKRQLADTLPLSWYLNYDRQKHGLESYGEDYGVPKPKIDDWENLTQEEYSHRCKSDVRINMLLWKGLKKRLVRMYAT